jgi:hypothetical protein
LKQQFLQLRAFLEKNERVLMPAFLLFGFIVDGLTLRRVDLLPETILVYAYLFVAGAVIVLIHLKEENKLPASVSEKIAPLFPLALSYVFGSLFSAFLIFYVKSASLVDSWPFIAVLFGVTIGWEVLKKYQYLFIFHLSLFFLGIFSFCIFAVPLWTGRIGTEIFFLSALIAVLLFSVFCLGLFFTGRARFKKSLKSIFISVGTIVAVVVLLYVTNTLPPIPLALKEIGVYHSLQREGGDYILEEEQYSIFDRVLGTTVHAPSGESVYVFSSVFTPVVIKTDIVHHWEYWNTEENKWIDYALVAFPATGGRDRGYRGFSLIPDIPLGKWRVSVETPDGLKIGRTEFTVVRVAAVPELVRVIR